MSPSAGRLPEGLQSGVQGPALRLHRYKYGSMETEKNVFMEISVSVFRCFRVYCRPFGASPTPL